MRLLKRLILTSSITLVIFTVGLMVFRSSYKGIECPAPMVISILGPINQLGNANVFLKNFGQCPGTTVVIDTRGGNAQQSEMFRDTLFELKREGYKTKCIVKDMALSGGAYILSGCAIKCVERGSQVMFHDAYYTKPSNVYLDAVLSLENMLNSYKVARGLGIGFFAYRLKLRNAEHHDWYLTPSEIETYFKVIEKNEVCSES